METVTPRRTHVFTIFSRAHKTDGSRSLNSFATSLLSRSVPMTSIVRSLEPMDTPSTPMSRKSSSLITFVGISTIINSLKEADRVRPIEDIIFFTLNNSCGDLINGIIICKFLQPFLFRTFFIASNSRENTSGFAIYLAAPRKPSMGFGSIGSYSLPPIKCFTKLCNLFTQRMNKYVFLMICNKFFRMSANTCHHKFCSK